MNVFLERSPDILLILGGDLRLLQVCGATERVCGVQRDAVVGKKLQSAALFGNRAELIESRCREALAGAAEVIFPVELGSPPATRHFEVRLFPHDGADGVGQKLYFIGRDITERMRAEREAENLARDAERASRIKDEFLATLSHELRTPLNAILGWTQMIKSGDTANETLLRALTQIEQSAQAQAKLVDDLLRVSDIVAGRLRLDIQPMRLVHAINAVSEALYPAIEAKGIQLETSFDLSADIVQADPARIQQVLWNLLSNAVKFTPAHGRIRVVLARDGTRSLITISDTGEGISPEFLPYVFERFRQADISIRKRHGGLGLGLAIARYLVEMHGGYVEAQSAGEGRGAAFHVRLPLPVPGSYPGPQLSRPQHKPTAPPRAQGLRGLRVLTVDDDPSTREMLEEALRRAGAEVLTADSAKSALEKLQRFLPDVLVSDIGMPNEDGYDLLRQVRRLPAEHGGGTPAIALTGYAREEDRAATWEAGYQAVTPKPVNLDELVSTIAAIAKQPVENKKNKELKK